MAYQNFFMKMRRCSGRVRKTNPQLSGKDDMYCEVRQRDNGESVIACSINQFVASDGTLRTRVYDADNKLVYEYQTCK